MGGFSLASEVWLTCNSVDTRQIPINQMSPANKKPSTSKYVGLSNYRYQQGVTFVLEGIDKIVCQI